MLETMLWRMQEVIVHLKGHGYWPKEDAFMAADYEVGRTMKAATYLRPREA